MFTERKLLMLMLFAWFTAGASADPVVYAVTINYNNFTSQFGTANTTAGTFNPIGPAISDSLNGLVQGPNGNLLSLGGSGNLDAINPVTGAASVIGATGLGSNAYTVGELNGTVFATDLQSNLYHVNTTTGLATLIGYTGIPQCPSLTDPNDVSDESLFAYGGKLYATFDAVNLNTLATVDSPELYQIDPTTGVATLVGPTALGLDAEAVVDGTVYGFAFGYAGPNLVLSLNPTNGNTTSVGTYNLNSFAAITGAAATPEPGSFALIGIGIAAVLISRRPKHLAEFVRVLLRGLS